jgi:hypothetical protein
MSGYPPGNQDAWPPVTFGKSAFAFSSDPGGACRTGRFWDADKGTKSFTKSTEFHVSRASKILHEVAKDKALKHKMKPWKDPLPKPRISPPLTVGDAVIKNSCIRLRGGRLMSRLFKMTLPSTTDESVSNSVQGANPTSKCDAWPALPEWSPMKGGAEQYVVSGARSAMNTLSSKGIQNSNATQCEEQIGLAVSTQLQASVPNRVLIVNGKNKAWFYPSKGLNSLFSQAGQFGTSGTKPSATSNPRPKPLKQNSLDSQRQCSYAEVLTMAIGGDGNGTGLEVGWGTDSGPTWRADDHGRNLTVNGGNEAGRGNINQTDCYNSGHERGRSYSGYARGWQQWPYSGYRYSDSRFNVPAERGTAGRGVGGEGTGFRTVNETGALASAAQAGSRATTAQGTCANM